MCLFTFKGQGVLSDRLRSFSMQDLSSYQSDSFDTGPGTTQSAAAQHQPRTMMRSKSENYNKGEVAPLAYCLFISKW